jgi:hypothetical protein
MTFDEILDQVLDLLRREGRVSYRALKRSFGLDAEADDPLGLGTLYARIGQPEQARAELSTALDLYSVMEMTFWLPQAEAALAPIA